MKYSRIGDEELCIRKFLVAERLLAAHPEEVAQSDGLDPDVVEAACYAHDLGHPPFGHITEQELNAIAGDGVDGFEGNAQSFHIVTKLAQHSPLQELPWRSTKWEGLRIKEWNASGERKRESLRS
jgi:dGTP triphosphohydrolase